MSYLNIVCYPESCDIEQSLNQLKNEYKDLEYCYILHNLDKEVDGSLIKEHYHIVLSLTLKDPDHNSKEKKYISSLFNIKHIEFTRNPEKSMLYLIHLGFYNKYQYTPDNIIFSSDTYKNQFYRYYDKANNVKPDFNTDFENVLVWIETNTDFISKKALYSYLRKNGLLIKCCAYMKILDDYIRWHNEEIAENLRLESEVESTQLCLEQIKNGNYRVAKRFDDSGQIREVYLIDDYCD